jgi:hypothetical protein
MCPPTKVLHQLCKLKLIQTVHTPEVSDNTHAMLVWTKSLIQLVLCWQEKNQFYYVVILKIHHVKKISASPVTLQAWD